MLVSMAEDFENGLYTYILTVDDAAMLSKKMMVGR